jgi:hypothetical protein
MFFRSGRGRPLYKVQFLFPRSAGPDPSIRSSTLLSATCWTTLLLGSRAPVWKPSCRTHLMASRFEEAAAVLCLSLLFQFCIPDPTSVPEARVPCAVLHLYGWPSSHRRQLIFSGIYNFPVSVPSTSGDALWQDSEPYAVSSALRQVSQRHGLWGPTDAPLTDSFSSGFAS